MSRRARLACVCVIAVGPGGIGLGVEGRAMQTSGSPTPGSTVSAAAPLPPTPHALALPANLSVFTGVVRDSMGHRIPFANVRANGGATFAVADDSGAFRMDNIASGPTKFAIRRIGYQPLDFALNLAPGVVRRVAIELTPIPISLGEVSVEADPDPYRGGRFDHTGFYERQRSRRGGIFVGPAEVEQRQPQSLSDLVFNVPGVKIVGRARTRSMRFDSVRGDGCRMNVFIDGHITLEPGDDVMAGSDIKAVEIYPGPLETPSQFLGWDPHRGYCGSIVVWTK